MHNKSTAVYYPWIEKLLWLKNSTQDKGVSHMLTRSTYEKGRNSLGYTTR